MKKNSIYFELSLKENLQLSMKTFKKIYLFFFSIIETMTLLEIKIHKMAAFNNAKNICYLHRYQYYWEFFY